MDARIFSLRSRRQSKAGVERASAEPRECNSCEHQAREVGGSYSLFAISTSSRLDQWLPPASRASIINLRHTWGFAALHSRLYSAARYRGLRYNTRISWQSLG